MAKRTSKGLSGAVRGRKQTYNPRTKSWVKLDEDGKFMASSKRKAPFKGIRRV